MSIAYEGATAQREWWYELGLCIAWHAAYWTRVKDFPTWEKVRPRRAAERAAAQTPQGHRSVLQVLAEQYGLPLRKKGQPEVKWVKKTPAQPKAKRRTLARA